MYVSHSHDDADVDIVKLAVQRSLECLAAVIDEDTDLLLLYIVYIVYVVYIAIIVSCRR